MTLKTQIAWLFVLAIPIACITWTITHEELFSRLREYCKSRSVTSGSIVARKFFYLFTCEYCFSFYVSALLLLITQFHLLFMDWRGYLVSGFSLVWVANVYMSLFLFVRTEIKNEGTDTKIKETELKK